MHFKGSQYHRCGAKMRLGINIVCQPINSFKKLKQKWKLKMFPFVRWGPVAEVPRALTELMGGGVIAVCTFLSWF